MIPEGTKSRSALQAGYFDAKFKRIMVSYSVQIYVYDSALVYKRVNLCFAAVCAATYRVLITTNTVIATTACITSTNNDANSDNISNNDSNSDNNSNNNSSNDSNSDNNSNNDSNSGNNDNNDRFATIVQELSLS